MTGENTVGGTSTANKRVNLSKAELLARGRIPLREVTLPKSGITLTLRDPKYARKTAILTAFNNRAKALDGEMLTAEQEAADELARTMAMQKAIVLECVIDPDTGGPFFTEADWNEMCEGDGLVIAEISNNVLNSMAGNKEAIKAEGNDSAQTQSDVSSSA